MLRYTHIAVLTILRIVMVASVCAVTLSGFRVSHTVGFLTINV